MSIFIERNYPSSQEKGACGAITYASYAAARRGIQYDVLYVVSESYLPSASSNHRFPSQFELSLRSTTQVQLPTTGTQLRKAKLR